MKKIFSFVFFFFLIFSLLTPIFSYAKTVDVEFFYSTTCTHCAAEDKLLGNLEKIYPEINVNRYSSNEPQNQDYLRTLLKKHDSIHFYGSVPLTFIENQFFVGYDNGTGMGKKIELAIKTALGHSPTDETLEQIEDQGDPDNKLHIPFLGEIDKDRYSLGGLAIMLGFLDGFNVCSLGALMMILSLVLALKSRKKTLIYGLTFILTTAIVYGLLMFVWYQIFATFASYISSIQFIVGLAAILGSIYFFYEFKRMRKIGALCNNDSKMLSKLHTRLSDILQNKKNIFVIIASILIFAALVTIIEFPCSAAIPIVYTGILAQSSVAPFTSFIYIALFLLFYLLDEIIIFLVAFFSMKLTLASPKSTIIITFIEGVVLLFLGLYYLSTIFG